MSRLKSKARERAVPSILLLPNPKKNIEVKEKTEIASKLIVDQIAVAKRKKKSRIKARERSYHRI